MVINNDENDKATILSNGLLVKYCPVYIYLGAFITDDASSRHSIDLHVESKRKHVLKFASFLNRNPGLPFVLKRRVAEACVLSTLLYGCESWLYNSYGKLNSLYMNMIKLFLNVRWSTCNDLCLVESGMLTLEALIQDKISKYLRKAHDNRMDNSALNFALNLISTCNTLMKNIIRDAMNDIDWKTMAGRKLQENIHIKTNSSKRATYLLMNLLLKVPAIYNNEKIPEYKRVYYTRLRLSSYNLKIETGRWTHTPEVMYL